jgi:hypothetical protein
MRLRIACCVLASVFLFALGLQAQSNPPGSRPLTNPSQDSLVQPSAVFQFLLSPQGRHLLRMGTHPLSKTLLSWMGEDTTGVPDFAPRLKLPRILPPPGDPPIAAGCTAATGNRFNLEPATGDPNTGLLFPLPQNDESVDFLPNALGATATGPDLVVEGADDFRGLNNGLGSSLSGYYVHSLASTANCTVTFEGGTPAVSAFGEDILGFGDPVVSADPSRHQVFYASLGMGPAREDINLYKTTAANLTTTAVCPAGTHGVFDAAACWPTSIGIDGVGLYTNGPIADKPHMRVDEGLPCAPTGCTTGQHVGGGDVYVTDTYFFSTYTPLSNNTSQIHLIACKNDLSACSYPETISGQDFRTQNSHISVRPDGSLSITYVDVSQAQSGNAAFSIKYVSCTPGGAGAPSAPVCAPPQAILTDTNAIPFGDHPLSGEGFRVSTYPKNDYQVETNSHIWQYVVWDRCKIPLLFGATCPDSDVYAIAADTGVAGTPIAAPTWSHAFAVANVSGAHEFMPWIRTDASRNIINIVYYTNASDTAYNHRPVVNLKQILPCAGTAPCAVSAVSAITTTPDEPQADNLFFQFAPGFGDYLGLASRGTATGASRAFVGFTANYRLGTTQGISEADEDNYITSATY